MIRPHPHIDDMQAYAMAAMQAPDGVKLISLAQNESLRPSSPLALAAAAEALGQSALYPDPDWCDLRHAIGQRHGIDPQTILCGNGSLDLIGCLARVYAGPDRAVLAPAHAYPFFGTAAQMAHARFDRAPEADLVVCADSLLAAVRPDTGLVFVANPGNPTGTRIPVSELRRLRAALRPDILLVIDEAYGEFSDHLNERCFDMVDDGNTVVLRTFSKAYGLAGLRVGWGSFPSEIAIQMRKVMNPNNVSLVAQCAASAAIEDQAYMAETCAHTSAIRDRTRDTLLAAGFKVVESHTNFQLIAFDSVDEARRAHASLTSRGVFLRPQAGVGLPNMLRATIAAEPDMALMIETLIAVRGAPS